MRRYDDERQSFPRGAIYLYTQIDIEIYECIISTTGWLFQLGSFQILYTNDRFATLERQTINPNIKTKRDKKNTVRDL